MLSDNGSNYVGATQEIKELVDCMDQEKLQRLTCNKGVTAKQLWFFAFPIQPLEVSLHCYFSCFCCQSTDMFTHVRCQEQRKLLSFVLLRSSSNVFRKTLSSGQPFNVLTSSFLGFYVTTREIPQADTKVSFCIFLYFIVHSTLGTIVSKFRSSF